MLQQVARRFSRTLRNTDPLARYGGEEFIVLLTDTSTGPGCIQVAERLRTAVESTPISTTVGALRVTVSIGVANLGLTPSLRELIARADAALYRAKAAGRNQVVFDLQHAAPAGQPPRPSVSPDCHRP